ncbi:uncharacterized protein LOC141588546 [Silene latifolia]|uniref:uncharacterized protein LOC141588546 n=1 Tax=Silene latifolia TaxID=37657 RepID=UPI003D774AB9
MAKRQAIEHFENTMRDVCSSSLLFGGKIVVFGGDFRQVLPIIPKIILREAINSSFVMSPLWPKLEKLHLTVNMRAMRDPAFGNFVLGVGDGSHPYENGEDIKLPRSIVISGTEEHALIERLIDAIYPDIQLITTDPSLTTTRAILTPKNDDAQTINAMLVSKQEGEPFTYRNFDEATDITTAPYPTEFLNTLQPSGLPLHELILKKNSPIILLRNLDPTSGLCNAIVALSRATQSSDVTVAVLPHCTLNDSWRRTRNIIEMTPLRIPLACATDRTRNFAIVVRLESLLASKKARLGDKTLQNLLFSDREL